MRIEWSTDALADLNRLAEFLQKDYPSLAPVIAEELIAKTDLFMKNPRLGRPIAGRDNFRQIVLRILNANYILQYRMNADRLVILRVFHGRESRE